MSFYNKNQIMDFLPHRKPFLFLDSVDNIVFPSSLSSYDQDIINTKIFIGSQVEGSFFVDPKLEILRGHFPGQPVLPGVVQVEIMAQMCPFIFHHAYKELMSQIKINIALLGIEKAKFKKPIYPGMNLKMVSSLLKVRGIFQSYECTIFCDEEKMSTAQIFASIEFLKKDGHE